MYVLFFLAAMATISSFLLTGGCTCRLILGEPGVFLPEAAGAWSEGRGAPPFLVCDALRAEVLAEEVQLVWRRLEGQLMQLLLR